jgi:DNA-binding XRE family transcriptional regulator
LFPLFSFYWIFFGGGIEKSENVIYCEKSYPFGVLIFMKNELKNKSPVCDLLRELHHRVEAKERSRISQAVMAERLGVSSRTYLEYLRGTSTPVGMRVVLDLLAMLEDGEALQLIQHWRTAQQHYATTSDTTL